MKILKDKKFLVLLVFIIMFIFTLTIMYINIVFSVPSADDFSMIIKEDYTLINLYNATKEFYFSWGGGVIGVFIEYCLNPLGKIINNIYIYGLELYLFVLVFVLSVYSIVYSTVFLLLKKKSKFISFIIFTILLFVFYFSEHFKEIYNWFVGCSYLWFLAFANFSVYFMVKYYHMNNSIINYMLMIVFSMISCTSFNMTPYVGISYLIISYLNYIIKKGKILIYIIPVIFMGISFLFTLAAPGNFIRKSATNHVSLITTIIFTILNTGRIFVRTIIQNPLYVSSFFISFYFGYKNKTKLKLNPLLSFVISIFIVFCMIFPMTYGYGDLRMPDRAIFYLSFVICITINLSTYILGISLNKIDNFDKTIKFLVCILSIYLLLIEPIYVNLNTPLKNACNNLLLMKRGRDYWINTFNSIKSSKEKNIVIKIKNQYINMPYSHNNALVDNPDPKYWVYNAIAYYYDKDSIYFERESK